MVIKLEELEMNLKQGKLGKIYLFHGEEIYLLEAVLKKIKNLFGERLQGINYIYIDDTNVENVLADIRNSCIWI